MVEIGVTKVFKADLRRLPLAQQGKALDWLLAFNDDPDDPRFEAHRLKKAIMPDLWTAKLDDAYRVIYRQASDGVRYLLLVDHHDQAYRRAEKLKVVSEGGVIEIVEGTGPPDTGARPGGRGAGGYLAARPAGTATVPGRTFMAWRDQELLDAGVPEHLLPAVRACDSDDGLLELALAAGPYGDLLLRLNEEGPPAAIPPQLTRQLGIEGVAEPPGAKVEAALRSEAASAAVVVVEPDELERVLAKPIEDWMIFLHPAQRSIVRRRTLGPARVRGGAGTGKTVVALHRAAFLARELLPPSDAPGGGGRILFTTFVSSLPLVLENLFERLAPDAAGRVEFVNVHKWAMACLRERGLPCQIDTKATARAFEQALATPAGQSLLAAGLSKAYLLEEVQYFIKGRALATVDDYLALPRTARGTPLRAEQRRGVWEVAQEYRRRCEAAGVLDFDDLIVGALRALRRRPLDDPYAAILVDEAQDLTEASLRLLMAALRPGGELLLVGDGQQSIYPGGFSLRSLGLDVRGRSAVLTTSYRSTAEILSAAMSVMAGHEYDDLEDTLSPGARAITTVRNGEPPELRALPSPAAEAAWLAEDVAKRVHAGEVDLGDVGVFCARVAEVRDLIDRLKRQGIAAQDLASYKGRTTQAVKVGTYHRAKGLEFKHTYLPYLSEDAFTVSGAADPDEALELARRRFFVGMTRARDRLVITWSGKPSPFLAPLLERRHGPA